MRTISSFTIAAALIAIAAPSSATEPIRQYVSGNFMLDLSGQTSGYVSSAEAQSSAPDRIQVESWSWAPVAKVDSFTVKQGVKPLPSTGRGEPVSVIPFEHKVQSPRDVATGQASGKRQHEPPQPGSIRVKVKFPWPACRIGATYPAIQLVGEGKTYRFEDTAVAACAADGATLNYAKVTVRGWDPATKQE